MEGRIKYFVFSVVPVGLSSPLRQFSKCLRTYVKYWRSSGIGIVVFLDGWGINTTFDLTKSDADYVLNTLQSAVFIVYLDKSIFVHVQCLEWLGFILNLKQGCLRITYRRVASAVGSRRIFFRIICLY